MKASMKRHARPSPIAARALSALERARASGGGGLRQQNLIEAQHQISTMDPRNEIDLIRHLQGHVLALQGRGGDRQIAHVTPGEVVIPKRLQTPEIMSALARAAESAGINPNALRVGAIDGKTNPRTGHQEFADSPDLSDYMQAAQDVGDEARRNGIGGPLRDMASSTLTGVIKGVTDTVGKLGGGDLNEFLGGSYQMPSAEQVRTTAMSGSQFPGPLPSSAEMQNGIFANIIPEYKPTTPVGQAYQDFIEDKAANALWQVPAVKTMLKPVTDATEPVWKYFK